MRLVANEKIASAILAWCSIFIRYEEDSNPRSLGLRDTRGSTEIPDHFIRPWCNSSTRNSKSLGGGAIPPGRGFKGSHVPEGRATPAKLLWWVQFPLGPVFQSVSVIAAIQADCKSATHVVNTVGATPT